MSHGEPETIDGMPSVCVCVCGVFPRDTNREYSREFRKKTRKTTNVLGGQARQGIESANSLLLVLSTEPLGHWVDVICSESNKQKYHAIIKCVMFMAF